MNYLWNGQYLGLISQVGGGRAMAQDAQGRRTKHLSGRMVYLLDGETGRFWTANALPAHLPHERYRCVHGMGQTTIELRHEGVESAWTVFVPREGPCEIWRLVLRNVSARPRRLRIVCSCETPIGGWYKGAVSGWFEEALAAVLVSNVVRFGGNYEHRTTGRREQAFLTLDAAPGGFDASHAAFVGHYDTELAPRALRAGGCTGTPGEFEQPILALQADVDLPPGDQRALHALAGVWDSPADVADLRRRFFSPGGAVEAELAAVTDDARRAIDTVRIASPDAELTKFYNGFLKHQVRLNVTWARAYYNGYRDLCQDVTNYAAVEFDRAWAKLAETLSYQYASGFAPRGWIEDDIIDQEYADSPVWIVPAVHAMLMESGDLSLLQRQVAFCDGPAASVYEHARLSVEYLWGDRGRHGLSKVHRGDWNDMLNMMGHEGRGESVWLSMALLRALRQWAEIAAIAGRNRDAATASRRARLLDEAVNRLAWDARGGFYHRGYTDAGLAVGTAASDEGMFLNPQCWAVLSGAARGRRAAAVMRKVDELLETPFGSSTIERGFRGFREDIGFLSVIRPGENVNAGVYNHANLFKIAADCLLKRSDAAWRTLDKLLPFRPAAGRNCEPFVMPNGYVGPLARARVGEAPFGWVTGSAGWLATVLLEYVFGLKPAWEALRIDPCLPPHWTNCSVTRPFRGAVYEVTFEQPAGAAPAARAASITADGRAIKGALLPHEKGRRYDVRVRMGP